MEARERGGSFGHTEKLASSNQGSTQQKRAWEKEPT